MFLTRLNHRTKINFDRSLPTIFVQTVRHSQVNRNEGSVRVAVALRAQRAVAQTARNSGTTVVVAARIARCDSAIDIAMFAPALVDGVDAMHVVDRQMHVTDDAARAPMQCTTRETLSAATRAPRRTLRASRPESRAQRRNVSTQPTL